MLLTDRQIQEAHEKKEITINPFEDRQIQPASYDLRVGEQGATTGTKKIVNIKETGYLLLQPGDFAVVVTLEELHLNTQHAGRLGLRSKYARKGLIATTGLQVDPGYWGRLMIGVTNLTPNPISLPFKDDFLSIELHRLDEPSTKAYQGPYQGKLELGPEEIEAVTESEGMALSEVLTTLRSLSQNVGQLTHEVKILEWVLPCLVGFGIAVIAVIVAIK